MSAMRTIDSGAVAVVVPVYRNAPTLWALARRLDVAMDRPWRLRLVVDACPAGSGPVGDALAAADPRIGVTHLPRNVGQHRALLHGLLEEPAGGYWVCLDGDLQDPPEAVPLLVDVIAAQHMSGVFAGRRGCYEQFGRRLTGIVHRQLMSALTGLPADAGAFLAMDRALRAAVVDALGRHRAPSIVAAVGGSGLPVTSIPVERAVRATGSSTWSSTARLRQSARTLAWAARHRPSGRSQAAEVGSASGRSTRKQHPASGAVSTST